MLKLIEKVATLPTIRLGMRLLSADHSRFMISEERDHAANELDFNSNWIEKCLAHEDGRSSRGLYNKAEYEVQRRHMMQEGSDNRDLPWISLHVETKVVRVQSTLIAAVVLQLTA